VGPRTSDDAAVWLLDDGPALVQTLDVITPVVDDPADFGAIAAANALSDVWAMGAAPATALSLLAFDPCRLPLDAVRAILAGALPVLEAAGCALVGGHTLNDPEVKFGFAVTGTVDPGRITRNSTARPGDLLYLTKPLGTGIIATALKGGVAPAGALAASTASMKCLNRAAARAAADTATAVTDVTGFGLLGHLFEMCKGSGTGAEVEMAAVPLLPRVRELAGMGMVPAGATANREWLRPHIATRISDDDLLPLLDPQTSGGLLIAVDPARAATLETALADAGPVCARIGRFTHPPVRLTII
jgi:selenide,water dikinase